MEKVYSYLEDRIGVLKLKHSLLDKPIGVKPSWLHTSGSICLFLFISQGLTGILLSMYYVPSPDHAYYTIEYVRNELILGWLIHGIHHWGAYFFIVAAVLHVLRSFYFGAYKAPREFTWITGVFLLMIILTFGFTGYLLAWDQRAYWATVVGTNFFKTLPIVGDFITNFLLGSYDVSAITLTHFYAFHVIVLPITTIILITIHIYLVRLHDLSAFKNNGEDQGTEKVVSVPFYPEFLFRDLVVCSVVFFTLLILSLFVGVESQPVAGTWDPSYVPRPEWYFLPFFEILKYFPGQVEILGVIGIPVIFFGMLFLLPFIDKEGTKRPINRPLAFASALSIIVSIVYLGILGAQDTYFKYGQTLVVPSKKMNSMELQGIEIYLDKDCSYCHNILGRGGRGEGADLSNVHYNNREKDWLIKYLKNPTSVMPRAAMPKYVLSEKELEALSEFTISLDFSSHKPIEVDTKQIGGWIHLHRYQCLDCHMLNGIGDRSGFDLSQAGKKRTTESLQDYFQNSTLHFQKSESQIFDRLNSSEANEIIGYLSTLNPKGTL